MPDLQLESDVKLVEMALQDADNFVYLVKRYQLRLFVYIKRLLGVDDVEAEDLLQEVFLKVYTFLNDFDPKLKFSSWVYRIAHNLVIDFLRKKSNKIANFSELEVGRIFEIVDEKEDVVKEVKQRLNAEKITKCLMDLKMKYREVIVLKFFEEKSYEEISDILRLPMGTVATLINRAKAELKKKLINQIGET